MTRGWLDWDEWPSSGELFHGKGEKAVSVEWWGRDVVMRELRPVCTGARKHKRPLLPNAYEGSCYILSCDARGSILIAWNQG